ncbi:VanW family protein [Sporohalobacter salinus]|uniref:VanW family protein n=1 Tax=Sporohalobacter salinus TaxID=1494606 RepID=UPI0019607846|nr:VanW family protein [Sporohalobacter salinus]MBM7623965.1 vancomycin resistance protein VanW [Sporohalobacter salinus]
MKNNLLVVLVTLVLLFSIGFGIFIGAYLFFEQHKGIIFSGVMIEGYNFGGLTKKQARKRLDKLAEPLLKTPLVLEGDNDKWLLRPEDIEIRLKSEEVLNKAFGVGRRGNLLERAISVWHSSKYGRNLEVEVDYNEKKVTEILRQISNTINIKPSNAYLDLETGVVINAQIGKRLNIKESRDRIISRFNNLEDIPVKLVIEEKEPEVDDQKLKELNLTNQLSSYETSFSTKKENRVHNIELAAQKVNATFLKSGEVFSFNQVVGNRNLVTGFKRAVEIVNQEFVTGVGGGVCQVSSTLYNSVLLGDFKVIERHNHSRPVGYVSLGRGATVYNNYLDFRFENSSSYPIMILATVIGNRLKVAIMGQGRNYKVKISTSELEILNYDRVKKKAELEKRKLVKKGKNGYRVKIIKKVFAGNKLIRKELISQDVYQPIDEVIKVPTK